MICLVKQNTKLLRDQGYKVLLVLVIDETVIKHSGNNYLIILLLLTTDFFFGFTSILYPFVQKSTHKYVTLITDLPLQMNQCQDQKEIHRIY